MSQRGHPYGLRLNIGVLWSSPYDLGASSSDIDYQFFVLRWLKGFFQRNYFFLFNVRFLVKQRIFSYLTVMFYAIQQNTVGKQESAKKLYLGKHLVRKELKLFRQRYYQLKLQCLLLQKKSFLRNHRPTKFFFSVLYMHSFFNPSRRLKIAGFGQNSFNRKNITRNNFLSATSFQVVSQLRLLRLKHFFEFCLGQLTKQKYIFFLTNLADLFAPKNQIFRLESEHLFSKIKDFSFVGTRISSDLLFLASIFSNANVALQWFYFSLSKVKKHHVSLSHGIFFNYFVHVLENLIYFSGILRGFLLTIQGKMGGASRTRYLRHAQGLTSSQQQFKTSFSYSLRHIPTFAGTLGVRLWFLY